jgi:tRNA(adenine34) deaminase
MLPDGPVLAAHPHHEDWMRVALDEASAALAHGDVPIGAVVVGPDPRGAMEVIAATHNERELRDDPTAHAEVLALRAAADRLGRWRLDDCLLVVTLEPCPMCAGAAWSARIGGLVFGAEDPKAGATGSLYQLAQDPRLNHEFPVRGRVRATESSELLRAFFAERRPGH